MLLSVIQWYTYCPEQRDNDIIGSENIANCKIKCVVENSLCQQNAFYVLDGIAVTETNALE